ncbi:MAG: hypothetical protein HEQ35_20635 [Gloeotrichia echinulata IR180]|jgi:hypothetical protein|nr:hypothetical protein [Gloeotrichia echinulata DEX184]
MRTTTGYVHTKPTAPTTPVYPPSVPLSVYRELATELQTVQAKLDTVTAKNQQLAQENQLLRQEITKVVQSLLHLQKLVDPQVTSATPGDRQVPHSATDIKHPTQPPIPQARPRQQVSRPRPVGTKEAQTSKSPRSEFSVSVKEIISPMPEPVFVEEQQVRSYPSTEPKTKEISIWWLLITTLLIMLTAFSAGYLIVRPMFEHQNR